MEKRKILFVDDVELFLELEKTFFKRDEFELLVARNGREAVTIVTQTRPDLVFLDLYMPEMNGDECCRQIKNSAELRRIPVVMVTHGGSQEDLDRCHLAGCDDVILKPINRHQIMETAKKFLGVRERREERCQARLRIHYGTSPEKLLTNFSINLTTGGLFLVTENILPEQTPLMVEFLIPDGNTTVRCKAMVAWVNHPEFLKNFSLPAGIGLQFLDLTLDEMDLIRRYLKKECLAPYW